mgnify:CR=1 FL=1
MPSIYTPEFAIAYAEKADEYGIRAPFHLAVTRYEPHRRTL